jgi:hypothetical protein
VRLLNTYALAAAQLIANANATVVRLAAHAPENKISFTKKVR